MYFVEFWQKSPVSGQLIEACGDRSVLIIDGRESAWCHHWHAKAWAKRHGFDAYKLCKGETFGRVSYRSGLHLVNREG